jgi:hypothetical protein
MAEVVDRAVGPRSMDSTLRNGSKEASDFIVEGKRILIKDDLFEEDSINPERSCAICGSSEGVQLYDNSGEVAFLCERHSVGILQAAEQAYWKRRRESSESESESNQ